MKASAVLRLLPRVEFYDGRQSYQHCGHCGTYVLLWLQIIQCKSPNLFAPNTSWLRGGVFIYSSYKLNQIRKVQLRCFARFQCQAKVQTCQARISSCARAKVITVTTFVIWLSVFLCMQAPIFRLFSHILVDRTQQVTQNRQLYKTTAVASGNLKKPVNY